MEVGDFLLLTEIPVTAAEVEVFGGVTVVAMVVVVVTGVVAIMFVPFEQSHLTQSFRTIISRRQERWQG